MVAVSFGRGTHREVPGKINAQPDSLRRSSAS